MTVETFELLLAAYGGDAERWPTDRREAARALLTADPAARRLHAEACALDKVMAFASTPRPARLDALLDRVMAAAEAQPVAAVDPLPQMARRSLPASAKVIELQQPPAPGNRKPTSLPPRRSTDTVWRAAAALAGALMLGVAVGTTDFASTTADGLVAQVSATRGDADIVLASLQADPILGVLDEDTR